MNSRKLPSQLELLRKKFSKARLTGTDFVNLCHACGITLRITADTDRGFYFFMNGRHYITLSSRLSSVRRGFVGWHEFAHFLQNFNEPKVSAAFHGIEPEECSERLADLFAIIALRPDHIRITDGPDFIRMIMTGEG
jgi:Zn-dependent peptidase ImmA (M78 family)